MSMDIKTLRTAFGEARLKDYLRLEGGYPVALAGMVFWAALGVWGFTASLYEWSMAAYYGTGLIFPAALLFSFVFRRPFLGVPQVAGSVAIPALIGMLLFWPMAVAAGMMEAYELIPLILAIGLSMHWPVIGWGYARTPLYTAHALLRAGVVLFIWLKFPEHRLDWMPLAVAGVYGLTVLAILFDTRRLAAKRPDLAV